MTNRTIVKVTPCYLGFDSPRGNDGYEINTDAGDFWLAEVPFDDTDVGVVRWSWALMPAKANEDPTDAEILRYFDNWADALTAVINKTEMRA